MSWDPVWEDIFSQQEWGKYPSEDLIRFVARNFYKVPVRKDIKILEVGCGPGANLWYIAREGFTVYGIDGSGTAVTRAKKRLDDECAGWQGDIVAGDIVALPWEDGFFDAVIDNEAVYCNSYEQSKKIYHEMLRVCKKNGMLFSRTFATGCWGDGTGVQVDQQAWIVAEGPLTGKGYTRFTSLEEIPILLEGSKIVETELLTRSVANRQKEVKEWLIIAEKI